MLLSSSLQPEDMNPSLLPWAQAAIDRDRSRNLPNTNLAPGAAQLPPASGKEASPMGWSKRQEPWEGRGDVLTPKPGAAQSRADTTWFKRINEHFCAQERQGDGQVTGGADRSLRGARVQASSAGKPATGLLGIRWGEVSMPQLFFTQGNAAANFGIIKKKGF